MKHVGNVRSDQPTIYKNGFERTIPREKKDISRGKRNVLEANKMECDFLRSFFSEEKLRWWVTGKKEEGGWNDSTTFFI